jgi:hypothetical protein
MEEEQRAKIKAMSFEQQKFAYEALSKEVDFRREKTWKIFSWVSTILLSITGGLLAITLKQDKGLPWWPHRALLIFSILALTLYAFLWINKNNQVRDDKYEKMKLYEIEFGIRNEGDVDRTVRIGYRVTISLLAIAAILSVVFLPK